MRKILVLCLILIGFALKAQVSEPTLPTANLRLSFLIFPPFSPLLTFEMRTFDKITVQLETNFMNTHGVNIKYFTNERMNGHFVFVGTAFLQNDFLRKDLKTTFLPYAGYGYAHRFGDKNKWIFDNRLGIGGTINADKNGIYPVLKTGIGRTF